jgi:hypothetical protein
MNNKFLSVAVLLCFSAALSAQSGWTRAKSDLFLKLDFSAFESDKYHNLAGDVLTTNTFRQQAFLLYGEYGITGRFAINASLPLVKINSFNVSKRVAGIGDARIEFKYALLKGKFPLAISVTPEFPTGPRQLLSQNLTNSFEKINLATGDGEFNIWTTLAVSHSFYPKPAYASFYTAFNKRTKFEGQSFQDQIQVGGEFGYKVKNKLWLSAKMYSLFGAGKKPAFADFIRANGTSFTGYSFSGLLELGKHLGVSAQYFNYTNLFFKSTNIYTAGQFSVGVSYQRKR